MAAEAGQTLEGILWRKEAERRLGNGLFFWGIGNALGNRVKSLAKDLSNPEAFFSPMKSRARPEDLNPAKIALWTSYVGLDGENQPLPAHVIVTSRATTSKGDKTAHYALVCYSDVPLALGRIASIDWRHLTNRAAGGASVGASQVTAVVEHFEKAPSDSSSRLYDVDFRARIVEPHYVRLSNPRILSDSERAAIEAIGRHQSYAEWAALVRQFRNPQERELPAEVK